MLIQVNIGYNCNSSRFLNLMYLEFSENRGHKLEQVFYVILRSQKNTSINLYKNLY